MFRLKGSGCAGAGARVRCSVTLLPRACAVARWRLRPTDVCTYIPTVLGVTYIPTTLLVCWVSRDILCCMYIPPYVILKMKLLALDAESEAEAETSSFQVLRVLC